MYTLPLPPRAPFAFRTPAGLLPQLFFLPPPPFNVPSVVTLILRFASDMVKSYSQRNLFHQTLLDTSRVDTFFSFFCTPLPSLCCHYLPPFIFPFKKHLVYLVLCVRILDTQAKGLVLVFSTFAIYVLSLTFHYTLPYSVPPSQIETPCPTLSPHLLQFSPFARGTTRGAWGTSLSRSPSPP